MKTLKSIFTLALIAFTISSCTKIIDFDLDDSDPVVVIEAMITDRPEPQIVKLSMSGPYYGKNTTPPLSGAEVTINDSLETHVLTETEPGIYKTSVNFVGKDRRTYRLKVKHDGVEYTAEAYMHPKVPFDTIRIDWAKSFITGERDTAEYAILFSGQEPSTKGNIYMWHYSINRVLETDTLRNVFVQNDDFVNGTYFFDFPFYEFPKRKVKVGDTVLVEMFSISEEYETFHNAVLIETDFRGFLFDGPPANVPTNIKGGALGFFGAAGVFGKYTIVPNL